MRKQTPYFEKLEHTIMQLGGMFNAHLHLDRAGTYDATLAMLNEKQNDVSHLSLTQKHSIIPMVHASDCYETSELETRVQSYLEMMADIGTTRADTVVDVTDDRVGMDALDTLLRIKQRLADRIDFRVGAYSPLGFRDDQASRWNLLKASVGKADFLGSLPERDDVATYPEHIGFDESCRRMLELSATYKKQVHIHVDQQNHPYEDGTERVLKLVRELKFPVPPGEPLIWLVHVISPSTYDEARFEKIISGLAEFNIGVICCPSAAISMRQIRSFQIPTGNSIARVLEMLSAGIWVRIGSDNICDITSPAGTVDLIDELFVLCNALRYYDIGVLGKLGAGCKLDQQEQLRVQAHLAIDRKQSELVAAKYSDA